MPAPSLRFHPIITGASAGLGVEFARQLAPRSTRMLLVARRAEFLTAVAADLQAQWPGLDVVICPADVATEAGRMAISSSLERHQFTPNLLINNAGLGDYGSFDTASAERIQQQIDVNITGLVMLTHRLLPQLKSQRPSGILNVSSLAGTIPLPEMAIYAATKAFVTSFTEALRIELLDKGVTVSAVCPGPTPTTFSSVAQRTGGQDTNRSGQSFLRMPNDAVVAQGLAALEHQQATIYPGWGPTIASQFFRLIPRWLMRRLLNHRLQKDRAAHQSSPPKSP